MRRLLRRLLRRGPSDEERVADACMGVEDGETLVSPGVIVREETAAVRKYLSTPSTAIIGVPSSGNVPKPILIGPSVRKPRWWEVWRWHRYPQWRRESREALAKFEEAFGLSGDQM